MNSRIEYPVTAEAAGMADVPLPFSLATKVGNLLFVSGQAAVDENGKVVQGSFEEEFRRSMDNLRRILEAAGSGLEHVVRVNSYIRDAANGPLYNKLYREYFQEPYPARSTITNCLPESMHFEIDCIAVVPE